MGGTIGHVRGPPFPSLSTDAAVNSPLRRSASLIAREINGEFVVLDTAANKVHQLNSTASLIWRCCDGSASHENIAAVLTQTFDVETSLALQDVVRTIAELRALNLLAEI
jgi:hypothetical protein